MDGLIGIFAIIGVSASWMFFMLAVNSGFDEFNEDKKTVMDTIVSWVISLVAIGLLIAIVNWIWEIG